MQPRRGMAFQRPLAAVRQDERYDVTVLTHHFKALVGSNAMLKPDD